MRLKLFSSSSDVAKTPGPSRTTVRNAHAGRRESSAHNSCTEETSDWCTPECRRSCWDFICSPSSDTSRRIRRRCTSRSRTPKPLLWYVLIALLSVDGSYLPADDGWTGPRSSRSSSWEPWSRCWRPFAIAVGDVSYVAPISKLVPVFVIPVEVAVFGQRLTPLQTAGIVVATAAVYVANYERGALLEPLIRAARSRPARLRPS